MGCTDSKQNTKSATLTVAETASSSTEAKTLISAVADSKLQVASACRAEPAPDVMHLLKAVFRRLDANSDGSISKEELSASLELLLDCSEKKSRKSFRLLIAEAGFNPYFYVFEQLDANQDGKITWDEFEARLHPTKAADHIIQDLKTIFVRMDANGDGAISKAEFSKSLTQLLECSDLNSEKNIRALVADAGLNPDFHAFEDLDTNHDGKITWEEFQEQLKPATDVVQLLKKFFNRLDIDGNGSISKQELSETFERLLDCSERQSRKSFRALIEEAGLRTDIQVFEQLDGNKDGKITWEEFEAKLKPTNIELEADVAEALVKEAPLEEASSNTQQASSFFNFLKCCAEPQVGQDVTFDNAEK